MGFTRWSSTFFWHHMLWLMYKELASSPEMPSASAPPPPLVLPETLAAQGPSASMLTLCLSMACVVTSRGSATLQLGSAVWGEFALQPLLPLLPHQPPLLQHPPQQQLPQLRSSVTPRLVTYAWTISTASPGPAAVPTLAPPSLTGALSVREQVWLLEKPA